LGGLQGLSISNIARVAKKRFDNTLSNMKLSRRQFLKGVAYTGGTALMMGTGIMDNLIYYFYLSGTENQARISETNQELIDFLTQNIDLYTE